MFDIATAKANVAELHKAVEEWSGAPLHPVVVEARMLLATSRAKILMAEVNSAALKGGTDGS